MVEINKVITKEIEESDIDRTLKDFLKKMILLQLSHISEGSGRWKLGKEFDDLINESVIKKRIHGDGE